VNIQCSHPCIKLGCVGKQPPTKRTLCTSQSSYRPERRECPGNHSQRSGFLLPTIHQFHKSTSRFLSSLSLHPKRSRFKFTCGRQKKPGSGNPKARGEGLESASQSARMCVMMTARVVVDTLCPNSSKRPVFEPWLCSSRYDSRGVALQNISAPMVVAGSRPPIGLGLCS
jgi:hypothetical protein